MIQSVTGMYDIFPEEMEYYRALEDEARKLFKCFGYGEIRTPAVEFTELFTRSVGEHTDIVEKEMFTFQDSKEVSLSLKPEGTASVVRAALQAGRFGKPNVPAPMQKYFYIEPMFRREKPQKGRQRQFSQVGVEVFGDYTPEQDADVIYLCTELLRKLNILDRTVLEINSLGTSESRKI